MNYFSTGPLIDNLDLLSVTYIIYAIACSAPDHTGTVKLLILRAQYNPLFEPLDEDSFH